MITRNQALYAAMKGFCQALVRLTEPADQRGASVNELTSSTVIEQARELPEYQGGIDELKADSVIAAHLEKRIGIAGFGHWALTANDLLEALVQPISDGKRPVFDEQFFDRAYTLFEDTFYRQTVECEAIAPVQGWCLSGELQERSDNTPLIKFSDDLEISQLSREEEKAVHSMELVRRYGFRWTDRLYAIRATYQRAKVPMRNDEEIPPELENAAQEEFVRINERIEEVLQTVRVFRQGSIRQGGIYHRVNSWLGSNIMRNIRKPLADPTANLNPMYLLETVQDLDDLKEFWQTVQRVKAKGHGFLNVAMRRFAEGNERHHVEDRLIDLMIAAEALSQSSTSQSKGRVIAEYVATHVVEADKSKVQDHMAHTYKLRNSIVHEGDASGWLKRTGKCPEDVIVFVNTAEEYLREALKQTVKEAAQ
jgi:Apea-like HEPN